MKVTIIIPFYNEVERINVENFYQIFNRFSHYNFLLVDDGSSDKTIDILEEFKLKFSTIKVLKLTKNLGKAEAIRSAVLSISKSEFICICRWSRHDAIFVGVVIKISSKSFHLNHNCLKFRKFIGRKINVRNSS